MDSKGKDAILRIPVRIVYNGRSYLGEAVGKILPFGKFFSYRAPGVNLHVLEAMPGNKPGTFFWQMRHGYELAHMATSIGLEIERYLA